MANVSDIDDIFCIAIIVSSCYDPPWLFFHLLLCVPACLFVWVYAIGIKMNALIPEPLRPEVSRFKLYCLLTPLSMGSVLLLCAFEYRIGLNIAIYAVLLIVLPLAYFYFIFSAFMFAARMLKTMVLGYPANSSDAIVEFFCLWMFPIGVWVIQPAMNRVLDKHLYNANV